MSNFGNSTPRAFALPRLLRNEVEARNRIVQRARNIGVQLQGRAWLVSLDPWPPQTELSADAPNDCLLWIDWAGASFELGLPESFCNQLFSALNDGMHLPHWPDSFLASFLQSVLHGATEQTPIALSGDVQVRAFQRSGSAKQSASTRALPHVFGFALDEQETGGTGRLQGRLRTDSLGLMLMAGLVQTLPVSGSKFLDDFLPLRLRVEVGCADLASEELFSLVPGDTVILQHNWIDQDAGLWLGWDGIGLRAVWEQDQLRITQLLDSRGLQMERDTDHPPAGDEMHELQRVPVRLTFDLGERTITLGELRSLQVGQILETGRPLSQVVSVRVNGALIGTGELVDVDGRLGVTLVSLGRVGG